jgi:ATP-dependent helicase YprA (DUF1998 family)
MSIFNLHSNVLADYRDYVRSFFTVADERAREFIDCELVEQARLWPEALLQVSPSYARVASVDELADRDLILRGTAEIFRNEQGEPFYLYQHQVEAIVRAARGQSYVETSDFPGEAFCVHKDKEIAKCVEYRNRRLALEA